MRVNDKTAIVVKLDRQTIEGFRGAIPIGYRPECGFYDTGAVVRLVLAIYDDPNNPFGMDTFLNPGAPDDARLLDQLARQDALEIHFFDDGRADYIFSKRIAHRERSRRELKTMTAQAIAHNGKCQHLDFANAKAQMMRDRPL